MLSELLGELIATGIAVAIVVVIVFVWRLLRKAPFVMAGIGGGLLGLAAGIALSLGGVNFRTEGSPAGTILFVVLGSVVLGAGILGLVLAGRGIVDAANRGAMHLLATVFTLLFVAAGVGSYFVKRPGAGGGGYGGAGDVVDAPIRKFPPMTERGAARSVELRDAYALAWKERGAAPALRMSIPAAQFAFEAKRIPETIDGPRHVDLLVPETPVDFARLRLYRDDSEFDDPMQANLYGRILRPAEWQGALWADEDKRSWQFAGFDCASPAFEKRTEVVGDAAPGCYEARGFFARWLPSIAGPSRLRLVVGPARNACSMTFLYRGRPATVTTAAPCTERASFAALASAMRLMARLETHAR
ncbi:hypothetical protein DSM104443_03549 [Usitatibacter rugosus]|uniref:Uncharacterized protein n=1 Tax=Usitatibacter rugosus TaxID=2732067 RepID=A0A6M4H1C6_9PROT|nr:hypothetical protein [Usitatibacter rugosus]QJR12463.1 hypothetical protein DSM104443_03549 [Usitatibacter rugosus]